jgi:hypothetical protein
MPDQSGAQEGSKVAITDLNYSLRRSDKYHQSRDDETSKPAPRLNRKSIAKKKWWDEKRAREASEAQQKER